MRAASGTVPVVKYDPARHHRRSIRLAEYDYASPGAYFITICTYERELVLEPEDTTAIVKETWNALPKRFPNVEIDEFIVMPNHVHGVIWIMSRQAPPRLTLGDVVCAFKSITAIAGNRLLGRSARPFWQRHYYERVLRDDRELNGARQYIQDNPLKWQDDPNNPKRQTTT
jgi:putative transposase